LTTKVELKELPDRNITALAFETNRDEELQVLDFIALALSGEVKVELGYANSRRLIVHVHNPE